MDTQTTPYHVRLWHRDFVLLLTAHLLISIAAYYAVFLMPYMLGEHGLGEMHAVWIAGSVGIGVCLSGPFIGGLVERYRRKQVFLYSAIAFACAFVSVGIPLPIASAGMPLASVLGLWIGVSYGLARRVLAGILMVDTTESFHRTEANYVAGWFSRFSLSLGPLFALILSGVGSQTVMYCVPAGGVLLACLCVKMVKIPFKAPVDEVRTIGTDRFFLPQGHRPFVLLLLIAVCVGIVFVMQPYPLFYAMLMPGCLCAIILEKANGVGRRPHVVTVSSLLCMAAFVILLLPSAAMPSPKVWQQIVAPLLLGTGVGLVGSRILVRLIAISQHCQRSSAVSTYYLSWDVGLAAGVCLGWSFERSALGILMVVVCAVVAVGGLVMDRHRLEKLKR